MIDPAKQTPITVLTGFLGAGKSTLLQALLTLPAFGASGLVINEFGDVPIDHDVLAEGLPDMAVTTTGCICCTVGGDLRAAIAEMHEAAKRLDRLPLPHVVVETTGMADPAPIINQLVAGAVPAFGLRDHTVARNYRLAGVVTAFDVMNGPNILQKHPESIKQLAFADRIVLTKADLADDPDAAIRNAIALVRQVNPVAQIMPTAEALKDLTPVFAPREYAPRDLGDDVEAWLSASDGAHHHHSHDHGHDHSHSHHGHSRHDHGHGEHSHDHDYHDKPSDRPFGVASFSLVVDHAIDKSALVHAMDMVQMLYGQNLLRLKGILRFADDEDGAYILQAVQHVVHPLARRDTWPSADRRTRVVAITFGIDPSIIRDMLEKSLKPAPAPAPA